MLTEHVKSQDKFDMVTETQRHDIFFTRAEQQRKKDMKILARKRYIETEN